MSPVRELLTHIWRHSQVATGRSRLKLNHVMADTLDLAIRSGMRFDESDLLGLGKFRPHYWLTPAVQEDLYKTAVVYRNASAYKALEARMGRVPFIVPGAMLHINTGDGPAGCGLARLALSAEFHWRGERVRVTSFNDAAKSLTACSYTRTEEIPCPRCERCWSCGSSGGEKILHRYTITHADIRAARRSSKRVPE